jgi:hypothetical protein
MAKNPKPAVALLGDYRPQPKQQQLHSCPGNEILYGGAAGGGKSHALRMEGLIWCLRIPGLQAYLFRRTYPDLHKNHILPALNQFPSSLCRYLKQERRFVFKNGSSLHMAYVQHEQDVISYQGAEIHLLLIDEATHFSAYVYEFLRARVRCTLPVPDQYRAMIPRICCGSNPGGEGHAWVKRTWVDFVAPGQLRRASRPEGGMRRAYIPAKLGDNQILCKADPLYKDRLDGLPPALRAAWRDGDWDVFAGQAFDNWSRDKHVIKPFRIPWNWERFRALDWGSSKPFSVGWYAVDTEGRIYKYREWYGCQDGMVNTGLKMDSLDVARGILEREKGTIDEGRIRYGVADPSIFNKPDGRSVAEKMALVGIKWVKANNDRINGLQELYSRLDWQSDGEKRPGILFFNTCRHTIRTLPLLIHDEKRPEDVDTTQEDHAYDETRYAVMFRQSRARTKNEMEAARRLDDYQPLDAEAGY